MDISIGIRNEFRDTLRAFCRGGGNGQDLLCVVLAIALTAAGIAQKPGPPAQAEKSYYPVALGNWWSYTVKKTSKKRTTAYKVWVHLSEEATFGPRSYQLSERPVTEDTPFFLGIRENGVVDPDTGKVALKNPLHTGDRWGQDAYEAVSAGKPCVVGGHRFRDCATIREFSFKPRYGPIGLVRAVTYARGVGPVEYVYFNEHDPKKIDSTLTIRSWHMKSAGNQGIPARFSDGIPTTCEPPKQPVSKRFLRPHGHTIQCGIQVALLMLTPPAM